MNTFTWEASNMLPASTALDFALKNFKLLPDYPSVQAFTAFKVNGLWVVTITYK